MSDINQRIEIEGTDFCKVANATRDDLVHLSQSPLHIEEFSELIMFHAVFFKLPLSFEDELEMPFE